MARPFKQGVDYFPLNVHMDNKVKFVEIKFGLEGFAVIVKILQHVYDNGYWVEWGEDDQFLFCSDIKMDFDKYEMIFSECMKREIFSRFMYEEHGILTSTGIQKRYKEMVRRRKDVNIVTEYLLIDDIIAVNDIINSDSDDIMNTQSVHDDGRSTQRKEKGNRNENETIKDIVVKPDIPYSEIIDYLNQKAGTKYKSNTKSTKEHINARYKEGFTIDDFKLVIDKKCAEWIGTTYEQYLRPATLFAGKFESYINQSYAVTVHKTDGFPKGPKVAVARRDGELRSRDIEIARNKWISEGNDPNEFEYGHASNH